MKRQMIITIDDSRTTVRVMNEDPGHSIQLQPFEKALSGGNSKLVSSHVHDHSHGHHHHNIGGRK